MHRISIRRAAPAVAVAVLLSACGGSPPAVEPGSAAAYKNKTLTIGALPDQDPEKLQRLYSTLATHLAEKLGVPVEYKPVTDYTASVNLFRSGDLDLVWFGGLTGVQARLQVPGSRAILQRDIDAAFRSVFIVNSRTGLSSFEAVSGLAALKGRRFTFGSESSTSGRLMPEYFLDQAGIAPGDFAGQPGFSGSHDKTIALVEAGTFEAGALNEQVWKARTDAGQVDQAKVRAVFVTPPYHDYHWVISPDAANRYGRDFVDRVSRAFSELDPADPESKQILDLFGAERFIPTDNDNYAQIEAIGRKRGLIT